MQVTLAGNIAARDNFTRKLSGEESQREVLERQFGRPVSDGEEALFGWVYKQPGMPTLQDCRQAAASVAVRFGVAESRYLLQRFAVLSLNDLFMGLYQEFVNFAEATLKWGCPPSASWDGLTPTYPEQWRNEL